jgi:hypothetical protein
MCWEPSHGLPSCSSITLLNHPSQVKTSQDTRTMKEIPINRQLLCHNGVLSKSVGQFVSCYEGNQSQLVSRKVTGPVPTCT